MTHATAYLDVLVGVDRAVVDESERREVLRRGGRHVERRLALDAAAVEAALVPELSTTVAVALSRGKVDDVGRLLRRHNRAAQH